MNHDLNRSALLIADESARRAGELGVAVHEIPGGGRLLDFGVKVRGGLSAGVELARICLAGRGSVDVTPGRIGDVSWPQIQVTIDTPVAGCLLSQYAGWQISVGKYFAMGSGPMRAVAAVEELFPKLGYRESAERVVGVLETSKLPDAAVYEWIAEKCGVPPGAVTLCAARTASLAGSVQIVARSVETALHKLHELGFDVHRIVSAHGVAPLAPVAADDLSGIGRTNDAILYGGQVTLWVTGDDESVETVGPKAPAVASEGYGRPFLEIFEAAGRDFYKIDPHLFSPAEIVFQNIETGRVQRFGRTAPDVLKASFGIA